MNTTAASSSTGTFFSDLWRTLSEKGPSFAWIIIQLLLIFLGAQLVLKLVTALTSRAMKNPKYHKNEESGKRTDTTLTIVRSAARYLIFFFALLAAFSVIGLRDTVNGLVLTAGIGSVALGFGAQSLIKDIVSGAFLRFEHQFSVGDYIEIAGHVGTVEATALRVTYLRTVRGERVIVPNGLITSVVNYSTTGNYATPIVVSTSYEANTKEVMEHMDQAIQQYAKENPSLFIDPPKVAGITEFASSSVDITILCRVPPMDHWKVERGIRLAIKEHFDQNGIEFPYPRVVVIPKEKHQ